MLQTYVRIVAVAGLTVIVLSLLHLGETPQPLMWLLFTILAMSTGLFTQKIALVYATMSVADTFFITSAMLFGPAPVTVMIALDGLVVALRRRQTWNRLVFNVTAPALSMWLGAQLFFRLARCPPLARASHPVAMLILPLLCMTAVHFLVNSGFTAGAIGLQFGRSPVVIWRQHFSWLSISFLSAGSVSFCLVLLIQQVGLWAIALVLPLIVVFHLTLRSVFGRLEDAQRHLTEMDRLYFSTVETLAMAIDAKDDVTHGHVRRVQAYARELAKALGVDDESTLKAVETAALLHDTGKLALPEHILNKPGKLTDLEFEKIKMHVDVGADFLTLVAFPYPVVPIVRCHHENWDGTGYPRGVAGEDIPIGARILSVVDCFDALTSDRPYRPAMTNEQAFEILRARRGTTYDPRVVDTFMRIQADIAPAENERGLHEHVLRRLRQLRTATATVAADTQSAAAASAAPHSAAAPRAPQLAAVSTDSSQSVAPGPAAIPDAVLDFVSLSRVASGESSMSDVLAIASTLLREVAPDATVAWYIADQDGGQLVVRHASGSAAPTLRGTSIAIGSRLTGWVAARRQPVLNSDAALDLGTRPATAGPQPLKSALSVPLTVGEALVGALTVYSPRSQAFNDEQFRVTQMIAPHVAQAVSHASGCDPTSGSSARSRFSARDRTSSDSPLRL